MRRSVLSGTDPSLHSVPHIPDRHQLSVSEKAKTLAIKIFFFRLQMHHRKEDKRFPEHKYNLYNHSLLATRSTTFRVQYV